MSLKQISDLPEELLEYILIMVSPYRDLKSAMLVCKQWYRITHGVAQKICVDFQKAVNSSDLQWICCPNKGKPTITERYSHSSVYQDKCIYVFGGCTSSNTTFNDLWCFDLANRLWVRPLAMGTYPSPKACASMVAYQKRLYLFGGWSHPTPYPLHQAARFYNQLHTYTPADNKWRLLATQDTPPGKAGHAAAVIRGMMVLFGGSHGHGLSSNELWVLDLTQLRWRKEEASGRKPSARYGHAMLVLDDFHLLVLGGCGGPNMQYTDIWLLDTSMYPWRWQEVTVTSQEHAPPQLWCHGACKVGDKVVVLSKASKPPVTPDPPVVVKPLLTTQLAQARRAMPDTSESSSQDSSSDTDDVIQRNCRQTARLRAMGRSPHHRGSTRAEDTSKTSEEEQCMEVDVIDICGECSQNRDLCTCEGGFCSMTTAAVSSELTTMSASASSEFTASSVSSSAGLCAQIYPEKPSSAPATAGSSSLSSEESTSVQSGSSDPSRSSSSLSDGGDKTAMFKVPLKSPLKGAMPSVRPNASRNRQRQLDTLRMYEEKFKAKMAAAGVDSKDVKVQGHNVEVIKSSKKPQNPMYIHTLDLSSVISDHKVFWLPIKVNQGIVPEETIFYSLHSGRGELVMFGGIQADLTSMQRGVTVDKQVVTNKVYLLKPKVKVR